MLSISPWGLAAARAAGHAASHANSTAVTVAMQDRPSTSFYGQSVSLIATVTGATTGSVEFFEAGATTPLGTANVSTRGVADYITNALPLGTTDITAEYFAAGATSSSSSVSSTAVPETVNAAPTRTLVAAPGNPIVAGESVAFTATVSTGGSREATGIPAGTVAFTLSMTGSTPITGSGTVDSAGVATFSTTVATAGTYYLTAIFTPSNSDYTASSSGVLAEVIADANVVGVGAVAAGTSTSPVSLRGGAQATIDVTQGLNAAGTALD